LRKAAIQRKRRAALKEQRTRIDHAIAALEGVGSPGRHGRPQADLRGHEAPGKVEAQVCSEEVCPREDEDPSNDERCGEKLSELMKGRWAAKQKLA